jgi:GH35 family endo-1,4-beta-xylanase
MNAPRPGTLRDITSLFRSMLLVSFLLSVLANPNVFANGSSQQIKLFGFVMEMDGAPLAGAFVGVSNESFEYLGGAVSNQVGYYEFLVDMPGTYYLGAQHNSTTDPDVHDYIPSTKTVVTREGSETRTDFRLRPAGDIVLYAYGEDGAMLRYGEFSTITNGHAYVTDLNGLPGYGVFRVVSDEYSRENPSSGWDLQIPAAIVPPRTLNAIHVQWEVPEFGKIILTIDNEGRGYSLNEKGEVLTLNFNCEAAKSELAALQRDYDLFESQGYEIPSSIGEDIAISRQHLATGEHYLLDIIPADMPKAIEEFNLSLKYCLWAHEQLLLEKAQADIEEYRKGNVTLIVVDQDGNSLPDRTVSVEQISHDSLFGASPTGKVGDSLLYADLLREAGINYAYLEAAYKGIEPSPGVFDWDGTDPWVQALLNKGFRVFGALALWCYRDSSLGDIFCPQYFDDMSFEELRTNIYNHMVAFIGRYKRDIDIWEINEPNAPWTNPLSLTWLQRFELYQAGATGIRNADPTAKVLYDANALPYEFGVQPMEDTGSKEGGISFLEFLKRVVETDMPFDAIGLEFYYSGSGGGGFSPPGLDLVSISDIFDQYSSFGKPIYARELSAPSSQVPNSSWWHRPWDEETQAEYLTKFYTIAFSKPLVREIGWSYGVSDENAFIITGGLLDAQLNPKPSYYALKDLIDSWTTSVFGTTDPAGEYNFRGFAGNYRVAIQDSGGQSYETVIHVSEQETEEITIEFVPFKIFLPLTLRNFTP